MDYMVQVRIAERARRVEAGLPEFTIADLGFMAYNIHLGKCQDDVCSHIDRVGMDKM